MKKIAITLSDDKNKHYLPGQVVAGTVDFTTTSALKFTSIVIRFTGLVETKIAKAEEKVYVLNQQVVVAGQANNAIECTLAEGKYSWPFEFSIPFQHLPTSGTYRHGTVKYQLVAHVSSKGFLGSMLETKATQIVQVSDLIDIQAPPFCNPLVVKGTVNLKPKTNQYKNEAKVVVRLKRSAYTQGQLVDIQLDISHPKSIKRFPGCWIHLVREEVYRAGNHTKEHTQLVSRHSLGFRTPSGQATTTLAVTNIVIPKDAQPSCSTTQLVVVKYHLYFLFDLRKNTGFMEGPAPSSVTPKLKRRLGSVPGGLEITIPVTIAAVAVTRLPSTNPSPTPTPAYLPSPAMTMTPSSSSHSSLNFNNVATSNGHRNNDGGRLSPHDASSRSLPRPPTAASPPPSASGYHFGGGASSSSSFSGPSPSSSSNQHYPREKTSISTQGQSVSPPVPVIVQDATAPFAASLGIGPMTPPVVESNSALSGDGYFSIIPHYNANQPGSTSVIALASAPSFAQRAHEAHTAGLAAPLYDARPPISSSASLPLSFGYQGYGSGAGSSTVAVGHAPPLPPRSSTSATGYVK